MTTSESGEGALIANFVRERFPAAREIDLDAGISLLDTGVIDSLGILELLAFLEETFDIVADEDDLVPENFESLPALLRFVGAKR